MEFSDLLLNIEISYRLYDVLHQTMQVVTKFAILLNLSLAVITYKETKTSHARGI